MRRVRHTLIASAIMAGLVLGAALASSPGTAGSSSATCTFGGIRYVGKTSQKRDLCLTLSSKGKIVREYTYDYVDTCGTGTTRALNPRIGVMPVTPTGAFVRITPTASSRASCEPGRPPAHSDSTVRRRSPGRGRSPAIRTSSTGPRIAWVSHRASRRCGDPDLGLAQRLGELREFRLHRGDACGASRGRRGDADRGGRAASHGRVGRVHGRARNSAAPVRLALGDDPRLCVQV